MAKQKPSVDPLFSNESTRRRRVLILPRFLREEADAQAHRDDGKDYQDARAMLAKWAEMESKGQLAKKETSLDANFLNDIFGTALGFNPIERASSNGSFALDRQFTVPGVGSVDGALGLFPITAQNPCPIAVIELKGADTDLDTDKSNGRTAVQQLFDYLNALPETKWGIVSNFSTIRLYNKDRGNQSYEVFSLQKLRSDPQHFEAFWCLFEKRGLLPTLLNKTPRALALLTKTGERQKEVGDELYAHYSIYRSALIATLRDEYRKPLDEAIRIAQKIFDRIIFIAFCEDRGLIVQKALDRAIKEIPAFSKVKNPAWQNFLGLFHGIDKGDHRLGITQGYNGGLFAEDLSIDNLELPDSPWATVFANFGKYDFKDEVNVDVLGHIFERSITELEKLRLAGLFDNALSNAGASPQRNAGILPAAIPPKAKMQKSAERKRFGIYYTPPEFTKFIVEQTAGELLKQRFAELEKAHGVTPDELAGDFEKRSPRLQAYYQQCLHTLRQFKIVDPACGSGAFLIAAYELLEDLYFDVAKHLVAQGVKGADKLAEKIPDFILKENLFGVDLSEEAVEITRLALWIRSARPGKTLADLTHNVIPGNSLVDDPAIHPRALNWQSAFPQVFMVPRPSGSAEDVSPGTDWPPNKSSGFDAVIGNPPWERLKLQEREFFAFAAPDIASAVSAATRRKLIATLEKKDPELYARYTAAGTAAEKASGYARASGRFPLTAKGDMNTYMLFAELARCLVATKGRVGILVPSGIATDSTTQDFFADIIDSECLIKLYDFENRLGVFPDVDGRFKFCTLILGGKAARTKVADFVFFAHSMEDLDEPQRHIALSQKDIALLNPNTKTCPIFRSRKDAELTKAIYKRVPILVDQNRRAGGNPWEIRFVTMFHQTNDAELFTESDELRKKGYKLQGNIFVKGKQRHLPLYEAKMIQAYDHRAASVIVEDVNWVRQGQKAETTPVEHQNPEFHILPRWWVSELEADRVIGAEKLPAFLCYKDITSSTNERTMIAAFVPKVAIVNSAPIVLTGPSLHPRRVCCLAANLNSFVYDFVARQKVGGVHLNFFIVEQLPTIPPDDYSAKCPWSRRETLEHWISERVLKLTCTAHDMAALANACDFQGSEGGGIQKWRPAERMQFRAELDAAFAHFYGLSEDEFAYVLSTFPSVPEPFIVASRNAFRDLTVETTHAK